MIWSKWRSGAWKALKWPKKATSLRFLQQMPRKGIQGNPSLGSRLKDDPLGHLERDIEEDYYAGIIRGCSNLRALESVRSKIRRAGYTGSVFLGNLLVQMYGRHGELHKARSVFESIRHKNLFSWNIMLSAYAQRGHPAEVLELFRRMELKPNGMTYCTVLSACSSLGVIEEGRKIHKQLQESGIETSVILDTAVLSMYAKCGELDTARSAFEKMPRKNVVSWNALICAYAQTEHIEEAVDLYERMEAQGVEPDRVTFVSVLGACNELKFLLQLHRRIVSRGFDSDVVVATSLLNMYSKCGSLKHARQMFDAMKAKNVVSWNVMIAAYAQEEQDDEAVGLFRTMDIEGIAPDSITFAAVLGACSSLKDGEVLHSEASHMKLEQAIAVQTSLVRMYARCCRLDRAKMVFQEIEQKDVVAWNAMIGACIQVGEWNEAIAVFKRMASDGGVQPDSKTFTAVLSACSNAGALEVGREIHGNYESCFNEPGAVGIQNALMNMYAKCGNIECAKRVFDEMQEKDKISLNVMIAAYMQQGCGDEAIQLFRELDLEGLKPDDTTYACVITACSCCGALEFGKKIHRRILESERWILPNVVVETALVSMYGKCGTMEQAMSVFNSMQERSSISWNAVLAACAHQGDAAEAIRVFREAACEGMDGFDAATFTSILIACSHAGMLREAYEHFVIMVADFDLTPRAENYRCMIDMLARSGRLEDAEELMNSMPFQPNAIAWRTFLAACRLQGNVNHAACAAQQAFKLDPENTAPYVLLSSIYSLAGKSVIEVQGKVHEFVAGDSKHPRMDDILAELGRLNEQMKQAGYVPCVEEVAHNVKEEDKEHILGLHSEKLAVGFGLIATQPGVPLLVLKNLRICVDCHAAIKMISKLTDRKITVRDSNRFHRFKTGSCSCNDYW